jgi:acid stress-induced BolA-like protein IbaG/YrbA
VGRLKTPLLRKLENVLTEQFPAPATVKLQEHDGIIGVVTSTQFAAMETIDRQNLIGEIIAKHLNAEERHQVQMIVCVTPEEGTGYLAGVK